MEEVEVPRGLIRTWKALVWIAITSIIFSSAGWATGRSYAREVTVEKRIEVPIPACRDEMLQIESSDDKKRISCPHPDQHGEFKSIFINEWTGNVLYLVCTCPHAQLSFDDAGAK